MDSIFNRREFLKKCRDISLLVCGSIACSREIAEGFIQLAKEPLKLVFIQGQNCLGCTISLTYGNEYQFNDFIQRIATLQVHPALSFNQGTAFMQQIQKAKQQGGYILVIEGSIPIGIKEACYLGGQPLADVLPDYAIAADTIICSGTCACHGGIPASGSNDLNSVSATEFLQKSGISTPLLNIPGCPVHPDHLIGSAAYITATGQLPPVKNGGPAEYFGETIHNYCGRFQHFTQDHYLTDYIAESSYCLLK